MSFLLQAAAVRVQVRWREMMHKTKKTLEVSRELPSGQIFAPSRKTPGIGPGWAAMRQSRSAHAESARGRRGRAGNERGGPGKEEAL